jgi:DNA-binding XRE family transcriptional regulator
MMRKTPHQRRAARDRVFAAFKATVPPDAHPVRLNRVRLDLTQKELSAAAGISVATITALETGKHRHKPHPATTAKLAAVLEGER